MRRIVPALALVLTLALAPAPALAKIMKKQARAEAALSLSMKLAATRNAPWLTVLKKDNLFEEFVDNINASFTLPVNLTLSARVCGESNAYYSPENKELLFCQELLSDLYDQAKEMGGNDKEFVDSLYEDAVLFTLYHEFGHAAVDVYDLPITGREEDAADQAAVWIILNGVWEEEEDGVACALDAADFFALTGDYETEDLKDAKDLPFWDSHSLDYQRYYNIVCWTYGYNPKMTEDILGENIDKILDPERKESCEDEYALMDRSLTRLLQPHYKE